MFHSFISIFQLVNLAANLAFWPDFPIASDNWSSGTITCANLSSFTSTAKTFAGNNADAMYIAGSSFHSITSIFPHLVRLLCFEFLHLFALHMNLLGLY